MRPWTRAATATALLLSLVVPDTAQALEGGQRSTDPQWREVPAPVRPDSAARSAELAARDAAMAADIERLRARLERVPSEALMTQLHEQLRAINNNYGWVPETQMVYGKRSVVPMLRNQNRMPPRLLQAFVQLRDDLAARGADLIIVPLVPTPHFEAHRLVDGIDATHEYYPGWTEMTIEMLEAGLEIIDTVDEFRAEAENPILVSWANDFHTGSTGRQIAARALAERLQRYDFAQELAPNRERWTVTERERTGAMWPQRISTVNGAIESTKAHRRRTGLQAFPEGTRTWNTRKGPVALKQDAPEAMADGITSRTFGFLQLEGPNDADLRRNDLVFIGDSQLHSAVYGAGLPEFYMAAVGGRFRWGSKSWKGFSPPDIYSEVVPDTAHHPRVVVLSFLPKYFWFAYDRRSGEPQPSKYGPRPMPAFDGGNSGQPAFTGSAEMRVRVVTVSDKRDPDDLDYDEALTQTSVEVLDGPHQGATVALRYWAMAGGEWLDGVDSVQRGQTLTLTVAPWDEAIAAERALAEHMIFDETNLPMGTPAVFVTGGSLALDQLRR